MPKPAHTLRILPKTELGKDIVAFLIDRQSRGLRPRTIEYYASNLRAWQAYLEKCQVYSVQEVTAGLLRQYFVDLGRRRNPGGVLAAYRSVKAFLRWYEAEYEPEGWSNPIRKVRAPKVSLEPLEPVSLSAVKAMLTICQRHMFAGDRDRAILLALLDTGCRASEFLGLDIGDVNLATGAVIVRKGKGGKFRTVFLGAKARRELLRYLRHRPETRSADPLWVTAQGHRLAYESLRDIVQRRARTAGVRANLHGFRRAFCLAMLRGGADVVSLSRLMGHSDVSLIARYAKQVQDDLKAVHDKSAPVDRLLALLLTLGASLWPALKFALERG